MNKCKHPSAIGVTIIYDEPVGLCLDCNKVHYRNTGRNAGRDVVLEWISRYPDEARNFHVKKVYKIE